MEKLYFPVFGTRGRKKFRIRSHRWYVGQIFPILN